MCSTGHNFFLNADLFTAEEEANWLGLNCCSHLRSFNMSVRFGAQRPAAK
jgi:hypothetical protein